MLIHKYSFRSDMVSFGEQRSAPRAARAMPPRGLHPRPPIGGSPPRAALLISYGNRMNMG